MEERRLKVIVAMGPPDSSESEFKWSRVVAHPGPTIVRQSGISINMHVWMKRYVILSLLLFSHCRRYFTNIITLFRGIERQGSGATHGLYSIGVQRAEGCA